MKKKLWIFIVVFMGLLGIGWLIGYFQSNGLLWSGNEVFKYLLKEKQVELDKALDKIQAYKFESEEWKAKAMTYWESMLEHEKEVANAEAIIKELQKLIDKMSDDEVVVELRRLLQLGDTEIWLNSFGINLSSYAARVDLESLYEWDINKTKTIPSLKFSLEESKKAVTSLGSALDLANKALDEYGTISEDYAQLIKDSNILSTKYDRVVKLSKIERTALLVLALLLIVK